MITRDELNEKTRKEMQDLLTQNLESYKISINEIDDVEELKKLEDELMKEHDSFQERIKEITYQLQDDVIFDGELYKKSVIAENIAYFLNKMEVEWSYTLGLYQLVKFWRCDEKEIPYEIYDSTLRILNQIKYKGYNEWRNILATNEYLSSCHAEYAKDTAYMIYLAQKHNTILDRMKLVSPVENEQNEQA